MHSKYILVLIASFLKKEEIVILKNGFSLRETAEVTDEPLAKEDCQRNCFKIYLQFIIP